MSRVRSLLIQIGFDEAGKSHNCQANSSHRIQKGQKRLKVRNGLGWDHYCMECAQKIIEKDIGKLNKILTTEFL